MNRKQIMTLVLLLLFAVAVWDVFYNTLELFEPLLIAMAPRMEYEGMGNSKLPETGSHESIEAAATEFTRLRISNPYGRVIIKGEKTDVIKGDLDIKVYAKSEAIGREYIQKLKLEWTKKGKWMEMGIHPDWQLPTGVRAIRIDYTLTVPAGMELDLMGYEQVKVEAITGKVKVKNVLGTTEITGIQNDLHLTQNHHSAQLSRIQGNIHVVSEASSIVIREAQGKVRVDGSQGRVELSDVKGDVELKASGTQIVARDVEGGCTVNAHHGSVNLTGIAGPLKIQSAQGNIRIEKPFRDVEIAAENGNVSVRSAENHSIHAQAFNGSVKTSHAQLQQTRDRLKETLNGQTGDGKYQLRIEVKTKGDIEID